KRKKNKKTQIRGGTGDKDKKKKKKKVQLAVVRVQESVCSRALKVWQEAASTSTRWLQHQSRAHEVHGLTAAQAASQAWIKKSAGERGEMETNSVIGVTRRWSAWLAVAGRVTR